VFSGIDVSRRLESRNLDFVGRRVKTAERAKHSESVQEFVMIYSGGVGGPRFGLRNFRGALMLASLIATAPCVISRASAADGPMHKCDPVTEEGWTVVPERQKLSETDGAPFRVGADWYVDRTTTVLPFCHYYNSIGIYSLNSYSLDPVDSDERVQICRDAGEGRSVAVAPYEGPCPPQP
jgi:hypothetical protein